MSLSGLLSMEEPAEQAAGETGVVLALDISPAEQLMMAAGACCSPHMHTLTPGGPPPSRFWPTCLYCLDCCMYCMYYMYFIYFIYCMYCMLCVYCMHCMYCMHYM